MILKSNSTTRRLEGYARKRGLHLGIARVDDNSAGVFFVTTKDGQPLAQWISLGWDREEAIAQIERMRRACYPDQERAMQVKIMSAETVMRLWSAGRAGRNYTVLFEAPGMTEWGPCRPWKEASVLVQDGTTAVVWSMGGGPDEETGRQRKPNTKAVRQQVVSWLRANGEALGEVPPRRLSGSPNGCFQEFTWDGPALATIEVA